MLEKLTKIINDYTGKDFSITPETILIADLGMNSLDLVQLACQFEDEFDIEITDRAIGSIKTVGDVITLIENQ